MKVLLFILSLHAALAFGLIEAAKPNETPKPATELPPQDVLLKAAYFENASFAIYQSGADGVIEGKSFHIEGDGYLNAFMETEIVESPTGNYIVLGDGYAKAGFADKHYTFIQKP